MRGNVQALAGVSKGLGEHGQTESNLCSTTNCANSFMDSRFASELSDDRQIATKDEYNGVRGRITLLSRVQGREAIDGR